MLRLFSATMVLIISQTSKYLSVLVLYYILIDTVACDTRMVTDSRVHQNIGREKALHVTSILYLPRLWLHLVYEITFTNNRSR